MNKSTRMPSRIPKLIVEVRPSKMLVGEIGLFAVDKIRCGSVIAKGSMFEEKFFRWAVFANLDKRLRKKIKQYCIQTKEGFYAPPDFNWLPATWNMNHSCNCNVGFGKNEDFIAVRDIKANEELCWDYGLGMSDPNFKMKCKCGEFNCRKLITGNDWKDEVYRRKNEKYMSKALLGRVNV